MLRPAALALSVLLCAACGTSSVATPPPVDADIPDAGDTTDTGPVIDNGSPSDVYPAFKPVIPQVVTTQGAPVLAHLHVVPAFFASDALQKPATDFLAELAASSEWAQMVGEYGGVDLTVGAPVLITDAAPTSIDDPGIKTWLTGKLDGTHPEWPSPADGTVYALFYPATTSISLATGASCKQFSGYHEDATVAGKNISYAVLPRCTSSIDYLTTVVSHELVEAATDPFPTLAPAYGQLDEQHLAWMVTSSGGEIGDMCENDPYSEYAAPDITMGHIQRTWSNASAKGYHDPCLPLVAGHVYFNSTPVLPDTFPVTIPAIALLGPLAGKSFNVVGVKVPQGQSRTIDVQMWSEGATKYAWTVSAVDVLAKLGYSGKTLQLDWDRTAGQNGEILHLTITTLGSSILGVSVFQIVSSLGPQKSFWTGVVATQ